MANAGSKNPSARRPSKGRVLQQFRQVVWLDTGRDPAHIGEILTGVQDYHAGRSPWSILHKWEIPDENLSTWKGDGILVCGDLPAELQPVESVKIPIVVVGPNQCLPSVPWVDVDQAAVGRLAAEHLLERGLQHFGFFSLHGAYFSNARCDAAVRRLQQAGFSCAVYDQPESKPSTQITALTSWLRTLPHPIGIISVSSYHSQELLAAVRCLGLTVPEDVAIVTMKINGEAPDPSENPSLSYVRLNLRRVGTEAAALLDHLMSGQSDPPGARHLVAPMGVEARLSTDMFAIPDPHVATALRFIWQNACKGIHVKDVLRVVQQSRRRFDERFLKLVGRSPHDEILRVQMRQIKILLVETNLSLEKIAESTGFSYTPYLVRSFSRMMGMTPGKYRSLHGTTDKR